MKKQIKDYLHLYMGCTAEVSFMTTTGMHTMTTTIIPHALEQKHWRIKPLLRPLSNMTEEELREAMTICYRSVYSSEPSFDSIEMVEDESGGGLKATEHPEWNYGLTITLDGPMFSANGRFLNIPVFDVTRYLLSKGFDLFGLIDAGLAIDKSEYVVK